MAQKTWVHKTISAFLVTLFTWTFLIFMPHEETKELGLQVGIASAYAGGIYQGTPGPVPPLPTDTSAPHGMLKYAWARMAGREDAVYLNIPSNQLSNTIVLPSAPPPMVLAKYDPATNTATLALMRMAQVGPNIRADLLQITPGNFHHFMGKHYYNFAWLDYNSGPGCDPTEHQLSTSDPPNVDNTRIMHDVAEYDFGRTMLQPYFIFGADQDKINHSNYYFHQRFNSDPCYTHRGLRDFDNGDGDFHNITQAGLYNLVALALMTHKAAVAFVANSKIRQDIKKESHGGFFTKTVKVTVSYWLSQDWTVAMKAHSGSYADFVYNPTWVDGNQVGFTQVTGQGANFDNSEILLYQWSKSQSGFTGLFVFIACIVIMAVGGAAIGALIPGGAGAGGGAGATAGAASSAGLNAVWTGALIGGSAGAVGGLVASGFSPTTQTTADITPFFDSSYDLTTPSTTGDGAIVASRTDAQWLNAAFDATPCKYGTFIGKIDLRQALACGGASHTKGCGATVVTQIGSDDPRFKQVYNEMFHQPTRDLQQYNYPYTE